MCLAVAENDMSATGKHNVQHVNSIAGSTTESFTNIGAIFAAFITSEIIPKSHRIDMMKLWLKMKTKIQT